MRIVRTCLVGWLAFAIATSAFAGEPEKAQAAEARSGSKTAGQRSTVWAGTALFAAGMGVGLYGFMHNENASFAEFGEASARNKALGAAGLSAAFAGGVILFLGSHHARQMPSIVVNRGGATVAKRITW